MNVPPTLPSAKAQNEAKNMTDIKLTALMPQFPQLSAL
jgi:hypothetical protein